MKKLIALSAVVVCLGLFAVGCSDSGSSTTPTTPTAAATGAAAPAGGAAGSTTPAE